MNPQFPAPHPRAQAAFDQLKAQKAVPNQHKKHDLRGPEAAAERRNVEIRLDVYESQDNSRSDLDPRPGYIRTNDPEFGSGLVVLTQSENSRGYWTQIKEADGDSEGIYTFGELSADESYSMNVDVSRNKPDVTSMGWHENGEVGFFAFGC